MKVVGIDLAGKEKNPTGFCLLTENRTETKIFYYDKDILDEIERIKPNLIAIDAPFTFASDGYFRDCDKLLREMGFKPLSPNFPNMKPLVLRARKLIKALKGYRVIEVFPQASKQIIGLSMERYANEHKFDALVCAITGKYYLEGKYMELGKERVIIPKL